MPALLAALAAVSVWLSAGTLVVQGGDASRVAAVPSLTILAALLAVALIAAFVTRLRLGQAWPLAISVLIWLPFVPGDVPAAFLLWTGPLEWFVWAAVGLGLVASRGRAPRAVMAPTSAPWIAAGILAVASVLAFNQIPDVIPGGDEPHYLAATQSLIKDADLRVENNYADGDYLQYFAGRLEPHFLKRATSGEIYSIHSPGVSVIILPAFAAAGYPGAVLMVVLLAALTTALVWRLSHRVAWGVDERGASARAWLATLAVAGTAPYFFHTFTIYPETVGGLCVMGAAWLLIALDDDREVSSGMLIGVGVMLAVLPWLHSRFAVLAAGFGLAIAGRLFARPRPFRQIAIFLSVPAVAAALWFGYFWVIWGSPSPAAPYGADTSTSASYVLRGLIGLIFDQQFGVVTTAPVYLAALLGLVPMFRLRRRLTLELLAIVIIYSVAVASYAMWWAGSAAPARFLVAVLPLAALPIAASSGLVLSSLLLLVSIALVVPRVVVEGGRFIYNGRGVLDATFEWLNRSVDLAAALPSVHRDGGSIALRDAIAWLVVFTALAIVGWLMSKRTAAVRWTVTTLSAGLAAMLAATIVWSMHGTTVNTPDRSKLAGLADYRPSWQTNRVDISGARGLSESEWLAAMTLEIPASVRRLNRVPAGGYEVIVNPAVTNPVSAFVGRNDPPIETFAAGSATQHLWLPVRAQTLNFASRGELPATGPRLTLKPIATHAPAIARSAVRAMRYGRARTFAFADDVYLEKDGFWLRGDAAATVVIDTSEPSSYGGLPITIIGGAVESAVELSIGAWAESLSLTPGQRRDITLPPSEFGVWTLRTRTRGGFRPSEREPGNRDVRWLAAWITIP